MQLTYAQAAKRLGRDKRTIRLWARQGMPVEWRTGAHGQHDRVVHLEVVQAWLRAKAKANPVVQYRIRAGIAEDLGVTPSELGPVTWTAKAAREQARADGSELPVEPARGPVEPVTGVRRTVDPLTDLRPLKGAWEYGLLVDAMKTEAPSCAGMDVFTAERIDEDERPILAAICRACPLFELCDAFRVSSQPEVGFWAGVPAREPRPSADRIAG